MIYGWEKTKRYLFFPWCQFLSWVAHVNGITSVTPATEFHNINFAKERYKEQNTANNKIRTKILARNQTEANGGWSETNNVFTIFLNCFVLFVFFFSSCFSVWNWPVVEAFQSKSCGEIYRFLKKMSGKLRTIHQQNIITKEETKE